MDRSEDVLECPTQTDFSWALEFGLSPPKSNSPSPSSSKQVPKRGLSMFSVDDTPTQVDFSDLSRLISMSQSINYSTPSRSSSRILDAPTQCDLEDMDNFMESIKNTKSLLTSSKDEEIDEELEKKRAALRSSTVLDWSPDGTNDLKKKIILRQNTIMDMKDENGPTEANPPSPKPDNNTPSQSPKLQKAPAIVISPTNIPTAISPPKKEVEIVGKLCSRNSQKYEDIILTDNQDSIVFGRLADCHVRFDSRHISSYHCKVFVEIFGTKNSKSKPEFIIYAQDLSSNGTFVNNKRIGKNNSQQLSHGDEITFAAPDTKYETIEIIGYVFKNDPRTIAELQKNVNNLKIIAKKGEPLPQQTSRDSFAAPLKKQKTLTYESPSEKKKAENNTEQSNNSNSKIAPKDQPSKQPPTKKARN